jgi:hypothetical protein
MTSKGGYRPDSRLATNADECAMALMEALRARTPEERTRALKEAMQVARDRLRLLTHMNGGQPPFGFAGA